MKLKVTGLVWLSLAWLTSAHGAAWTTDLPAAVAQARQENKLVLVNFTGSDWCGWCIRLKREVFSEAEFETFADQHLVLVEVDFPRSKPLSAEQRKANEALASKFGITGYPTIIFLNGDGKPVGKGGYVAGGPKPFIARLQPLLPAYAHRGTGSETRGAAPLPLFGGAQTHEPRRFSDLELQSISGPKNRRVVMINHQTFGADESIRLKLGDQERRVRCVEIREKSALVKVEGEADPRELMLRQSL